MMPLRLNLLSTEKIRYLKKLVRIQFAKDVIEITLACVCVLGIALLGGQTILQDHFNSLASQIVSVNKQYSDSNHEIKTINSLLNRTEKLQKEYQVITPKIAEFARIIPDPIRISDLNINLANHRISVSGEAPRRDDLLAFETALRNLSWIESVDIPLSQLTDKENLNFSISAVIRK